MSNFIKFFLSLVLFLGIGLFVFAQDETSTVGETIDEEVIEAVNLDENIQPEDLEVEEPNVLPDSPFYFLKEWGRNIQSFFTFNSIAKAKLKEKFANEKLIELKRLIEQNKNQETVEKAIRNYQNEIGEMERVTERIRETAEESEEVGKFLDKFIQQQALHQRLLQKLKEQVSPEVYEKIEEARLKHLERFGEVMNRLENKEKLQERLEKNLEEVKGSQFKNFKNLEVLLELEEKVPEEAKEAIQKAQENAMIRLKGDLEQMSPENQEKFKEYLERIGGLKETQLEILENLKSELETSELKENLIKIRERILEKAREKIQILNCPEIEKPTPEFCAEGRIVIKKNEKGCLISFECVIPAEVEIPEEPETPTACITLWDPVCGINGKTYSNACFAKLAGVEAVSKGECKEKECLTDADCSQPRCGPLGTLTARCVGVKAKCLEGKCQIISVSE